jgi:hypothetical protein
MSSSYLRDNTPLQYRTRAREARAKAAAATDEATRQPLLRDAEMWDRMAEFEEKTRPQDY